MPPRPASRPRQARGARLRNRGNRGKAQVVSQRASEQPYSQRRGERAPPAPRPSPSCALVPSIALAARAHVPVSVVPASTRPSVDACGGGAAACRSARGAARDGTQTLPRDASMPPTPTAEPSASSSAAARSSAAGRARAAQRPRCIQPAGEGRRAASSGQPLAAAAGSGWLQVGCSTRLCQKRGALQHCSCAERAQRSRTASLFRPIKINLFLAIITGR